MDELVAPEKARDVVLSHVSVGKVVEVDLLDAVGRVAASDLTSDIDVSPFAHAAMDGFAVRAEDISHATEEAPIVLKVVGEEPAGSYYEGNVNPGECVRIMTGAFVPHDVDSVVKYEMVDVVEGDGRMGSSISFTKPAKRGSNIRPAGEDALAGGVVLRKGEVVKAAGVGFLASCGVMKVSTYARPRVAVLATGSELVDPAEIPPKGKIRNSNSYAIAACVRRAGCDAVLFPIVEDSEEALAKAVFEAARSCDFVVTTGGAANGDYDFIKKVVQSLGELYLTTVNMRPGKAQTFGIVQDTPVFGLPGNPAAAYVGFELLVRPALRKMQGHVLFDRQHVTARLSRETVKKDSRRMYMRATMTKDAAGYAVHPASNQSSGLFGVLQNSNCLMVVAEGPQTLAAGCEVDCIMLDIPEEVVF